jgi:methionyl aminopeptidase
MKLTAKEIQYMRTGGKLLSETLSFIIRHAQPGVTPKEIDARAQDFVKKNNAKPAFLGFGGFPGSVCISRDHQVVHGPPNDTPFKEGELVSFDFGVLVNGIYTDAARTICIGQCDSPIKKKLIKIAEQAFFEGVNMLKDGVKTGDIGEAVQTYVEKNGFGVVRTLVGHGIGRELHGDPKVPNFGKKGTGAILQEGMAIAIEPMITEGSFEVATEEDGWTISTVDKSLAAHYENTVLITKDGYDILTI